MVLRSESGMAQLKSSALRQMLFVLANSRSVQVTWRTRPTAPLARPQAGWKRLLPKVNFRNMKVPIKYNWKEVEFSDLRRYRIYCYRIFPLFGFLKSHRLSFG
jgi:hypothetical protein